VEFEAVIEEADRGGAVVTVPDEVHAALGESGRIPVQATIDGIAYRGSVVRMGGRPILGVLASIREELGKGPGDTVMIAIERDDGDRTVTIPDDLSAALAARPEAKLIFEALAYSHQREYVRWIEEAKRPDTRERRIQGTLERLLSVD
jgi:hypothetical protein